MAGRRDLRRACARARFLPHPLPRPCANGETCCRYYLRTRAAADAIKFTVDQQSLAAKQERDAQEGPKNTTVPEAPGECLACGA